jgi:hypothetical protein
MLAGDRALQAMLLFHGLTMNGGVLHAIECLQSDELTAAEAGYRYFGLDNFGVLLKDARAVAASRNDSLREQALEKSYKLMVPNDEALAKRFEAALCRNPDDFAPLDEA